MFSQGSDDGHALAGANAEVGLATSENSVIKQFGEKVSIENSVNNIFFGEKNFYLWSRNESNFFHDRTKSI